jgi:hypothetical protein
MPSKSLEHFQIEPWMGEHIQSITISVSKSVLREEQARGFDQKPLILVDRKPGMPMEGVKPFGIIEMLSRSDLGEVVEFIWRMLHAKSPVGDYDSRPGHPGFYRNSHLIMVNGVEVNSKNIHTLDYDPQTDKIQFVNASVYARKIEGIYTSSRIIDRKTRKRERKGKWHTFGWSPQAPKGVYRVVHKMARTRYGRTIKIRFTMSKLNLGVLVRRWWKGGKKLRTFELADHVYPTIELIPMSGGVL